MQRNAACSNTSLYSLQHSTIPLCAARDLLVEGIPLDECSGFMVCSVKPKHDVTTTAPSLHAKRAARRISCRGRALSDGFSCR